MVKLIDYINRKHLDMTDVPMLKNFANVIIEFLRDLDEIAGALDNILVGVSNIISDDRQEEIATSLKIEELEKNPVRSGYFKTAIAIMEFISGFYLFSDTHNRLTKIKEMQKIYDQRKLCHEEQMSIAMEMNYECGHLIRYMREKKAEFLEKEISGVDMAIRESNALIADLKAKLEKIQFRFSTLKCDSRK